MAKSFSRIFFRNAINQGLALVQSTEAPDAVQSGETVTVDFAVGEIVTSQGERFSFPPLPEFLMGILEDGGLIPHVKKSLQK